ncbi:MAG: hypothetical protein ACTSQQ_06240 [Candidatus Helarchaeota archaeon]
MSKFQKILASIGKRLMWWRAEKMDLYVLTLMARETVRKYREIYNGDLQRAVDTLKEQFASSAKTYLSNFMDQMKFIVSKDIKDLEYMSGISLYSILGKNYRKWFSTAKYMPKDAPFNDDGVDKFINISPKCLLCSALPLEEMEDYKNVNYGEVISYALGSLIELILEYVGYKFNIQVREKRCFLRGDPYSEIEMLLHPREED